MATSETAAPHISTVLPYPRSRAPFCDLLVVQGPDAARPAPLPFLCTHRSHGVTLHADTDLPNPFNGLFLGVGRVGSSLIEGPLTGRALDICTSDDIATLGPYLLVTHAKSGLQIEADAFGLYPIYWGRFGPNNYIANRLHLLIEAAHQAGHKISVNYETLCMRWFLDNGFCLSQTSEDTLITQVAILKPEERLVLTRDRCERRRAPHADFSPISRSDYTDLVAMGAKEIRSNVYALASNQRRLTAGLTGGRDSRMIYAALVAEDLHRQVPFHTLDIEDDVTIACGLLDRFGGQFDDQALDGMVADPFERLLESHLSFGLAAYDDIPLLAPTPQGGTRDILASGGVGEVYRTLFANRLPNKIGNDPINSATAASQLKTIWPAPDVLPPTVSDTAYRGLSRALGSAHTLTWAQAMEDAYLNFGVRFQFGASNVTKANAGQILTLLPLCAPSLLQAARRMPMSLRHSGRLVFDVSRALHEPLACAPYDRPDPDRSAEMWPVNDLPGPITLHQNRSEWRRAIQQRYGQSGPPRKVSGYYRDALDQLCDDSLGKLRDVAALGHMFTPEVDKKFAWYRKTNHRYGHVWASRLHTVAEVLRFGGGVTER